MFMQLGINKRYAFRINLALAINLFLDNKERSRRLNGGVIFES